MKAKRKKTELGRTLAKIRIDFDETGADMAKKLDISSSQMFNVEVGLAQVGYEFIGKVKEVYDIDLTDIMNRGGFVSKITIDLDELSAKDKAIVLEIWSGKWGRGPTKKPVEQPTSSLAEAEALHNEKQAQKETTPPVAQPKIAKVGSEADTVGARKARGRPKTMKADDGIGFMTDESVDDLEGLEEVDVL